MSSSHNITKKLVNSPQTCVDDNLQGLVAAFPGLRLHPKYRVVTLNVNEPTNKVAILGGGGSGHEPFTAGMVGNGMLQGGVAGGVFASPPAAHVLYAIAQLYQYYTDGVLVVIGNYTGDRLNFGKAIEKAKVAGIKVEGIIVGEDVASCHNKTGGRGMCGEVFLYKMCGAMTEEGRSLHDIKVMATEIHKCMATLGVCLSACSLPGQPPLFEILPDELELGAGVHGEAGIRKMKMGTAAEVVATILDEITDHLELTAGSRTCVMLNNLGGTSILEMNILCGEAKKYLNNKEIKVERIYSGHLKSSLEMHGFQICVLNLHKEHCGYWLKLLDDYTDAPAWPGTQLSHSFGIRNTFDDDNLLQSISSKKRTSTGPKLTRNQTETLRKCLEVASNSLVDKEDYLNRLDSGCGDGDCGITLKNFASAVLEYIKKAPLEYPSTVLWEMSEIAETDMGGTSGGIYSLGLAAASQTYIDKKAVDCSAWVHAWEQAIEAISKYGGAEAGDRTMLDAMIPAVTALKNAGSDWKAVIEETVRAAEDGSKSTANMTAKAGRASYVSSEYIRQEDAGAHGAAVWIKAILLQLQHM